MAPGGNVIKGFLPSDEVDKKKKKTNITVQMSSPLEHSHFAEEYVVDVFPERVSRCKQYIIE